MSVIVLNNLSKSYGKSRGIIDLNLEVFKGEIFGFIGPNGAGKSTTMNTLLNFIFPSSGGAKILGHDVVNDSKEIKRLVGYVPSEVNYYENIKVKELLEYSSRFYENYDKSYEDEICKELEVDLNKKVSDLSLGNKKKVAIVQALCHRPKLLILDEPTNGLDPLIKNKLFTILKKANEEGMTIFLSSHNLVEVENFCNRVAVIKEGKIIDVVDMLSRKNDKSMDIILNSPNINEQVIKELGGIIEEYNDDYFKFTYRGDINDLIRTFSNFNITKLEIKEKNLEDSFLNYY